MRNTAPHRGFSTPARVVALAVALLAAFIGFAPRAQATPAQAPAPLTWVGGHGPNWSTTANWSPARAPVNGDALYFDTSPTLASTNDLSGLTLASITTRDYGVALSGNGVAVVQGIYATIGYATIGFDELTLAGTDVFLSSALTVSSSIAGPGNLHIVPGTPHPPDQGGGALILTGSAPNTYTGNTSIVDGVNLKLAKDPGVPAIPFGTVTVAANVTPNATRSNLILASSDQIGDAVTLNIPDSPSNPGGLSFESSGTTTPSFERVGPLGVGATGLVSLPNGSLLAVSSLTMRPRSILALSLAGDHGSQVHADDSVAVGGASLSLANFLVVPVVGQSVTLVDVGGKEPVSGTFAGLPEGAAGFTRGTHSLNDPSRQLLYRISYQGGDGNDITETPIDSTEFLLRFSYQRLLGRAPDPGGLAYWNDFLRNDGDTTFFTRSLTASVDGRNFVVQSTYQRILGRPADPGGLAYWRDALVGGLQVNVFKAALFASVEYRSHPGAGSNQGFVTGLYASPLGFNRVPDPAGLAYWTDQLDRGQRSRTDVALVMLQTDDSAVVNLNDYTLPLSVRGRMSVDVYRFLGGDYLGTLAEALPGPLFD